MLPSLRPLARCLSTTSTVRDIWPTGFKHPILHKRDFPDAKESGEFGENALNPVRAAPSEATCSIFRTSEKLNKFVRLCMVEKNRMRSEREIMEAFRIIKKTQMSKIHKTSNENRKNAVIVSPLDLFHKALENARPLMFLEKIHRGGVLYSVPAPITIKRSEFEGMRWIIRVARDRDKSKLRFHEKLADVIVETAAYQGRVIAIKDEHHKVCEINRAYAHFRRTK